jgi:hypothetical protein
MTNEGTIYPSNERLSTKIKEDRLQSSEFSSFELLEGTYQHYQHILRTNRDGLDGGGRLLPKG